MTDTLYPIKRIIVADSDRRKKPGGGGKRKVFGAVGKLVRRALMAEVQAVQESMKAWDPSKDPPGVAKVILKREALAKSHRPDELFSETCPVIGIAGMGEMLISVHPDALERLASDLMHRESKADIANISTIQQIVPFSAEDACASNGGVAGLVKRIEDGERTLKVRLFRHREPLVTALVDEFFKAKLKSLDLPDPELLQYSDEMTIYRLKGLDAKRAREVAGYLGTQSLGQFPKYHFVRTTAREIRSATVADLPPPPASLKAVMGIIDSGVNPKDPLLAPWIADRIPYVPAQDQDHEHGSFVAGLAINARSLNQGDQAFCGVSARLVDVVAVPKSGFISEDDLLDAINDALHRHPEVRVWNLSLAGDVPCTDGGPSHLGMRLDELQDKHDVTFVVAAGNIEAPFRTWPPVAHADDRDRIGTPADSVRALTIGSVAHLDRPNSMVKRGEPSPFSRRGPGPLFQPKPELSHQGGNCDAKGACDQVGVLSLNGRGMIVENVGTSFASPQVGSQLTNVRHEVPTMSRNLAHALLIHGAACSGERLTAEALRYRGFGTPPDLGVLLGCRSWEATLAFEFDIASSEQFIRRDFPIPDCLRNQEGLVSGEFIATLVYDPPLDPKFNAEYVRANIDVSLGTFDRDEEGFPKHVGKLPAEPRDIAKQYEAHQVEHGFKWSPIKVYRKLMMRMSGDEWRLVVTLTRRKGEVRTERQRFALVMTVRDPEKQAKVYNDVIGLMNRTGWAHEDIRIEPRLRLDN